MPCSALAAISHHPAGATPISSDASANTVSPVTNTRRRPSRSPAREPSSSRPPKTSVYASCTQDSPVGPKPIASATDGRAVKMIELSSRIMK